MINEFSGWQYLLIDLANQFGLDKELFEARIKWAEENLDKLETLVDKAETPALYVKAMLGVRRAQRGEPIGHLVGFDASNSGMQVMSALTGCVSGANACGLVDPNRRADAYSECTGRMNQILQAAGLAVNVSRKAAKTALMTLD